MGAIKNFLNRGVGQVAYFFILIGTIGLVMLFIDQQSSPTSFRNIPFFVLGTIIGYISSLKRVNDTRFVRFHVVLKNLLALLCSVPIFSFLFSAILCSFSSKREDPHSPFFEQKNSESNTWVDNITKGNQLAGGVFLVFWILLLIPVLAFNDSPNPSPHQSAVTAIQTYPFIFLLTFITIKAIKSKTKIGAAIISFLYWSGFVSLLIFFL